MCETPDCWDVLADKIIGWMDPKNHPAEVIGEIAYEYWRLGKQIKSQLPPSAERQVSLRKLLESFNWAIRSSSVHDSIDLNQRHAWDFHSINFWIRTSESCATSCAIPIAYQFYVLHEAIDHLAACAAWRIGFERVQAARLLLESRDAAVRAYLESLAEQQKQELRVASQSE